MGIPSQVTRSLEVMVIDDWMITGGTVSHEEPLGARFLGFETSRFAWWLVAPVMLWPLISMAKRFPGALSSNLAALEDPKIS